MAFPFTLQFFRHVHISHQTRVNFRLQGQLKENHFELHMRSGARKLHLKWNVDLWTTALVTGQLVDVFCEWWDSCYKFFELLLGVSSTSQKGLLVWFTWTGNRIIIRMKENVRWWFTEIMYTVPALNRAMPQYTLYVRPSSHVWIRRPYKGGIMNHTAFSVPNSVLCAFFFFEVSSLIDIWNFRHRSLFDYLHFVRIKRIRLCLLR